MKLTLAAILVSAIALSLFLSGCSQQAPPSGQQPGGQVGTGTQQPTPVAGDAGLTEGDGLDQSLSELDALESADSGSAWNSEYGSSGEGDLDQSLSDLDSLNSS